MMAFGKSLREAREAKGLTIAQLAEQTHLAPGTIDELENENFKHIAAPIYGRGFVRLYCEAVGLESAPYISEFMEILNGNREPTIRERAAVEPPPEPPRQPNPAPPPRQPNPAPPRQQPNLFRAAPLPEPPAAAAPAPTGTPPAPARPVAAGPAPFRISRYAAPVRVLRGMPPAVWRIGALALAALALLVLLGFGLRALRRATAPTMPDGASAPAAVTGPDAECAPAAGARSAPRTPQEIPPLYLD